MLDEKILLTEIEAIKNRNKLVEADKSWELSWTRRLFIFVVTYFTIVVWLEIMNDSYPWLKAFVPAGAYLLSTLSLPFIKQRWVNKQLSKIK